MDTLNSGVDKERAALNGGVGYDLKGAAMNGGVE